MPAHAGTVRLSVVSPGGCCARSGCLRAPRSFRATQQDPKRVRPWCEHGYPVIRAEAPSSRATVYLGDEFASTGVRHAVNIISAIVLKGKLRPKPRPALEAVKPSTDEMWIERRAQPDRESRVRNADDLRRKPENALCRLRRSCLEVLSVAGWSVGGPNREGLSAAAHQHEHRGQRQTDQAQSVPVKGAGQYRTPERPATVSQVFCLAELVPARFRVLVLAAAMAGLRWAELIALRRCDLDLAGRAVHVYRRIAKTRRGEMVAGPGVRR